jgi:hypothetical protein
MRLQPGYPVSNRSADFVASFEPVGSKYSARPQVRRNLTDSENGFLKGKRYLLMDRDTKYSEAFRSTLKGSDVEPVRLPPKSPNLNAQTKQWNFHPFPNHSFSSLAAGLTFFTLRACLTGFLLLKG